VAVKLKPATTGYTVFDVSHELRARGWQVPAYTFPENLEDLAVLRVVVRNGMTADLADILIDDIERVIGDLEQFGGRKPEAQHGSGFHH
jgi:glutamate decarboxylase